MQAGKRRWIRRGAVLFALLSTLGCATLGCSRADGELPPHIVLFSVDTLRADHLGLAGYSRDTSPNIDAFASTASHFENAVTVIPKTAPSMATVFTGLHPREHGVRSNFEAIPETLPMLAERLRERGYRTAAFVGSPALRAGIGFARGFDSYSAVPRAEGVEGLLQAYFAWAKADWRQPTFVWIHTLDPHGPYRPPPEYEALFLEDALASDPARVPRHGASDKVLGAIPRYQARRDGERRVAAYVARYDAEIRLIDDAFGRVLDDLRERDVYEESVVLFSSDHGESLGEHNYYFEHGWFAYEPSLRIPLLIKAPGQRVGERVTAPVSILDLLPTLAALAGLPAPERSRGIDLLGGVPEGRSVLVESSDRYDDKFMGLRTLHYKYLKRMRDGREELYDLESDPGERLNLAAHDPERTAELRAEFERELAKLGHGEEAPPGPVDDETREQLRALGYSR